ncbi:MAG: amino acid adenylation domain-containing protein [Lysobacteraceae bacterium]|nr:MAG: amino acid adenylation domain-containing protein [Xanthomonadaceae bacterium]
MLLKDLWRHKIVVRDDGRDFGPTSEISAVIDGPEYEKLADFTAHHSGVSLSAMALACLHRVLEAYGNGAQTVIGYVTDRLDDGKNRQAQLHPSIVDHRRQSHLTRLEAVRDIDFELGQEGAFVAAEDLLGQGYFDAVLFETADGRPSSDRVLPLALIVRDDPAQGRLQCRIRYVPDLFEDKVIGGVLDIIMEALRQIAARPQGLMADFELISDEQKRQLDLWNATDGDFPEETRLDELFEDAVRRSRDECAVVCGPDRLTYDELNRRCNRLAHRLLGKGVTPGEIVGLYLDKSHRIVVATMGLWKAGAAYLPFDPSYPSERIQFAMQDTGSRRIITHRHYSDRLREMLAETCADVEIIDIDEVLADPGLDTGNPGLGLGSRQVAYVTYTSGTTGVPKAVPKTHRSVVNSITDLSDRYQMREAGTEHVALFAALVFEPFMRQTLIALINSQTLVVVPDDVRLDPLRFPRFVVENTISYLNGTRSVLQHFDLSECPSLKRMLLVGEELTPSGLRTLREKFHGRIINEYAFTETAFVTAIKEYAPGDANRTDRSIGRPLRNVKCYIVSQNMKRVPIGAIGELYIGGVGVANGYLNRPELTAERFLDNPFQTDEERSSGRNARIYKTGDLARFLPDGQIEFMGRSDFQLKLNGVRVEPGEIEARALEFPGVRQCVVVTRGEAVETGNWRLVGYYVADANQPILEADLLAFLESRLIRVMVPARMVRMEALPVNVNGKVDRHALPEVGLHATPSPHLDQDHDGLAEDGLIGALKAEWSEVLGVRPTDIGDDDDFFRLGGQSVTCLQLIMRIWQQVRISVSVEDVYRLKTFGQLAHHLELKIAQEAEAPLATQRDDGLDGTVLMLATGLQQGMLYQSMKTSAASDAYVMQSLHHYHCAIDPVAMEQAWIHAQRKYPSLRLRFEWQDDALQCLDRTIKPLVWRYIDLSHLSDNSDRESHIADLQRQDRHTPYKLDEGQLFRVYLVKQSDQLYSLLFSCHHIILDGWSLPLLHDNVHRFYIKLRRHELIDIQEDTAYVAAQRYLESHRHEHLDYWQTQFERLAERGDFAGLVNAQNRYKVDFGEYDRVVEHRTKTLTIDAHCVARIKDWCAQNRVTLHSILQFAWHKVLFAIGGSPVTAVGTVISGRGLPIDGIENSVGLYINTLPSIVDHADQAGKTIAEALTDIQQAINRMNSRSAVELFMVQTKGSKRRLFETLLVLENYPRLLSDEEAALHHEYLRFEKSYDSDKVDYPFAVVARESRDALDINLWHAGELFDDRTIDTLLETLGSVFQQIAGDFDGAVSALDLACRSDHRRFDAWNRTQTAFPDDRTLHAAFEIAADSWPDAIAVVAGDNQLTYRELNRRANQLARFLAAQVALKPDDFIGLVVDKSEWMVTAILAVWKAGAAYVPIDPSYPDDRIHFIFEDTRAKLILTDSPHAERLGRLAGDLPCQVFGVQDIPLDGHATDNPAAPTTSTDLAYAIYTSGTTGRPKAVLIEHRGVINLHTSLEKLFALRKDQGDEAILSFSNYVFDHFVEQMTDALLSGQKLVMLDDAMRSNQAQLYAYMNRHGVTYLSGTPSVLSLYEYGSIPSLRRIDAIGEDFTTPVFNKIRSTFDGLIINGYGPTEISITSHKRLYPKHEPRLDKSIGHPVANTTCYVLNPWMQRVPVGGMGELYIGGVGVARGYLNRPELTAERFIANPFQTQEEQAQGVNSRLYKTGDLVRWLPNGEIEYLGRNDMQVKIRGQRVELGEIEAILSSYPGVARAIVLAREYAGSAAGGDAYQKYLVAFYLSANELQETDILQWMRARLPQAIVPVRVIRILEIPVTASGKLDVKRLPPTEFALEGSVDYVQPANQAERDLCRLWSKVTGIDPDRIGSRDDFFGSGGDSLRAIKLAQSITQHFGQNFNVAAVFAHPNIKAQAKFLKENAHSSDTDHDSPAGLGDAYGATPPVSLAQERLLFIDDFVEGTAAYNIPFALALDTAAITPDAIAAALRALLRRHAALRTLLQGVSDGVRVQNILPPDEALSHFDIARSAAPDRNALDTALVAELAHVFRLDEELPVRARLFTLAGDRHKVFVCVVFHHTCFDGWSWRIFREELQALLEGALPDGLPVLKATYADFAVWQRQQLSQQRLGVLFDYWLGSLAGWQPVNLPLDHPRPAQFDYLGREVVFDIDRTTSDQLKVLTQTTRTSFFSILLAAYYLTLKAYSGQSDLVVGTPSVNRRHGDFDGVVGFFVNLLALRTTINGRSRLLDYLRSIGSLVLQAQLHEDLPFEQVVKRLDVEKDPSRHPIVQAVFSLLNKESVDSGWSSMQFYVPEDEGRTTVKFDLSVTVSEKDDGLSVNFTYAASLFDAASIDNIIATYRQILQEFCRLAPMADSASLSDIRYVEPAAYAAAADAPQVPPAETLHAAFERIATSFEHEIALSHGDTRLTYGELDARANQLAHALLAEKMLKPDDFVALVLDKSEWSVIAILAVWKAGAAYVPIDPGYPDERIAFMLDDTRARAILVDDAHYPRVHSLTRGDERSVLNVQKVPLEAQSRRTPATTAHGGHLAYAIYTSGTTGRPKAVLVQHRNVLSFRQGLAERYFGDAASKRQAILFLASYVFDFSVEQLVLSILSGNTLIVPESSLEFDDAFYQRMNREKLSYISGTPTHLQLFDLSRLDHLHAILVAGEAFRAHHFDKMRLEYQGPLYNAYGTTETTVYNLVKYFAPGTAYRNDLGAAIQNTELHILDDELRELPTGGLGEMYLAGDCVGAGYLNRDELTHTRFIPNPFQSEQARRQGRNGVLYKTGDLVRRRHTGELEFFGRNDHQVKINGVRIELGEIEAVAASFPGITQCAVVARHDDGSGGGRLVCYYVAEERISESDLANHLRSKLTPAMLPSSLTRVDGALPLTVNGKLDIDALARFDQAAESVAYVAPSQRTESRLCRIWSEVLHGKLVGIHDDFFQIGGDSIAALHLTSRIRRKFGQKVSVKHVFDFPTVHSFSEHVLKTLPSASPVEAYVPPVGECALLPIQAWFFAKDLRDRGHWNQYLTIRVASIDIDRLRIALDKLSRHHDAFRLRYRATDADPAHALQFYGDAVDIPLRVIDIDPAQEDTLASRLQRLQGSFDLERGPLCQAAVIRGFSDGSARIWMSLHHLIVDSVSWEILCRDLEALYEGAELESPTSDIRQWSRALRAYTPSADEARLWEDIAQQVETEKKSLAWRPSDGASRHAQFTMSPEATAALIGRRRRSTDIHTIDLMLAALGQALRDMTGRATHFVTMEGHGREAWKDAPDVQDMVGWLTTMHPLAVIGKDDIGESLTATRASRGRIPFNGIGYGALRGAYGGEQAPLPDVSFNFLGNFADPEASVADNDSDGVAHWRLDPAFCGISKSGQDENASDSLIDVTARCIGNRMIVDVDSRLNADEVSRFTALLRTRLDAVSAYIAEAGPMIGGLDASGSAAPDAVEFEPYFIINEKAVGPTLFVLPPGEGGAESYLNNLAKQLPNLRLVLFNNVHLHTPMQSFEEIARYYLAHVRKLQPRGAYNFFGWSFGGVVSLEMSLQLLNEGESVSNLLMVDSFFNVEKTVDDLRLPRHGNSLDPINHRYKPEARALMALAETADNIVLFKAIEPIEKHESDEQRRVFEYYAHSPFNNLDTLLPPSAFTLEILGSDSHFSWIHDKTTAGKVFSKTASLVQEKMTA